VNKLPANILDAHHRRPIREMLMVSIDISQVQFEYGLNIRILK